MEIKMTNGDAMQALSISLDRILNGEKPEHRKYGYVLMVFEDHGNSCSYVANGVTKEMLVALFKDQIDKLQNADPEPLRAGAPN